MVGLVLGAGLLRGWNLSGQSYWMDEGFTVAAVQALQRTGQQVLPSGFGYSCPAYCFPTVFVADALGDSPTSYRLLAAVAGTAFVALLFLGVRRLWSAPVALLAAFFAATSYFQVAWSRQARWYTLFELFLWIAVFAFYQALYAPTRRALWIALTAVTTALAVLSHDLGWLLPAFFAAWLAVEAVRRGLLPLRAFVGLTAVGAAGAFGALVFLNPDAAFILPYYANFYLRSYWVLFVLAAIACVHPYNRWRRETAFLLLLAAVYVLPLTLLADIVNYRYLFPLTPVLFVLGAVGALAVLSDLRQRLLKALALAAILGLFFASGQGVFLPRTEYFLESDDPTDPLLQGRPTFIFVPQPDWEAAYAFVAGERTEGDIVVSSQSALTNIYLGEPGYWIRYSYNGKDYMQETADGRDFYAGATVVPDGAALEALLATRSGHLVIDSYALRRLPAAMQDRIRTLPLAFEDETNSYSRVSVYAFGTAAD